MSPIPNDARDRNWRRAGGLGLLLAAAVAGVAVPPAAWILALGPLPVASLALARLYGYSARLAPCGLAASLVLAAALLPLAAWLAHHAAA